MNYKKTFIIFGAIFFLTGIVLAAPTGTFYRNVLPEANNTYDLGSTSPSLQWKNLYVQNATVSGTCTGCGGTSLNYLPFTAGYFVGTSTATSTFAGGIESGTKIGAPYFVATSTTATSTFFGGLSAKILNTTSTTASSTFSNGVNLTKGCFSVNGSCITGTVTGSGTANQVAYWSGASALTGNTGLTYSGTILNAPAITLNGVSQDTIGGYSASKITVAGNITINAGGLLSWRPSDNSYDFECASSGSGGSAYLNCGAASFSAQNLAFDVNGNTALGGSNQNAINTARAFAIRGMAMGSYAKESGNNDNIFTTCTNNDFDAFDYTNNALCTVFSSDVVNNSVAIIGSIIGHSNNPIELNPDGGWVMVNARQAPSYPLDVSGDIHSSTYVYGDTDVCVTAGNCLSTRGAGTVTSLSTDATLSGGPCTSTCTLGINLANQNIWSSATTTFQKGMIIATNSTGDSVGIGTSTPSAKLDLNGKMLFEPVASTTAPTAFQATYRGQLYNDNQQNQLTYNNGNNFTMGGNLYSATAAVTLNSATPTTAFSGSKIGTTTIAANSLKIGQRFTIWGAGYYSTPIGNTSTVTVTPSTASTTSTTNISTVTTAIFPASATNLPYDFRLNCTIRSLGTAGTLVCDGTFNYATALTGVSPTSNTLSTVGMVGIDTTVKQTLDVKVSWSAVTTQTATVQESWIDF